MATKVNANVSFDIPAILSNPVLGFVNFTSPQILSAEIEKLKITQASFRFQKAGGTFFDKVVPMQKPPAPNGKLSTNVSLDADSTYNVTVTLSFLDKDDVTSPVQVVNTADEVEYGQVAKRIFGAPDAETRPVHLAGAVMTIENPDGADWVSEASRAVDGLVYFQRIPVGSYTVLSIVKAGYGTLNPTEPIVVTTDGINWNESQPSYVMIEEE